jgi:asparagine synthase (glutamine-hydrolysing)
MCGIDVVMSPQVDPAQVMGMNDLIRHRGPDDEGYVFFSGDNILCAGGADTPASAMGEQTHYQPKCLIQDLVGPTNCHLAFGHRRLSIVDLSRMGHQPMCDVTRRYWITFNGEIYNHLEIRAELELLHHQFVSRSDTEVILAAYHEWGDGCLSHFVGMWAFAIYDAQDETLFVARDPFGIKPLYYWMSPQGELVLGSEIKQFTAVKGWKAKVNPQRVYDFLAWGILDHTDETLFERVFQVPPGSRFTLKARDYSTAIAKDGRLTTERWYQLTPQLFSGDLEHAEVALREYLTDSIALHLRADVSVGSCLSGGLDSSSIVFLVSQLLREANAGELQKTFSACSKVERFDERGWIEAVVHAIGVDAHYVYPDVDRLFEEVSEITWHQDEPFGSTSIFAQWNVFRAAKENGVTVMLDGQGADELLAGYHSFFSPRMGRLLRGGRWYALISEVRAMKRLHGYSALSGLMYLANAMIPNGLRDVLRRMVGKTHSSPPWLDAKRLGCVLKEPNRAAGDADSIQALSITQLESRLQMLLHWEDRDSMAHSIESRVPFLSHRLVEFVVGLPDEFKLANGITKRVLRGAMSGRIPDVIRDRMDKVGFLTPEEVWIRESATSHFRQRMEFAVARAKGILRLDALEYFEGIVTGTRPFDHVTWRLISFGEWLKRFDVAVD